MSRLYLLFAVDAEAYDHIVDAITDIVFILSAILMLKSDGALVGGDSNNQLGRCMQPAHNGPPSTITCMHYLTLHCITLYYITLHYITLHYVALHVCSQRTMARRVADLRSNPR